MNQRIAIDRIELTLDGLPVSEAELLSAHLQSALTLRLRTASSNESHAASGGEEPMHTALTGRALVDAIASRLADAIGARLSDDARAATTQEPAPWP
jgi:hypothetical protein